MNKQTVICKGGYCDNVATHIQITDPYIEEIHDDIVITDMCDECYQNSLDDI